MSNDAAEVRVVEEEEVDAFFNETVERNFRVVVEERVLYISREALASWSPVFQNMLFGDFKEAREKTVELKGKTLKNVLDVFHFLFPVRPFTKISLDNTFALMQFADEYDCAKMKEDCELYLNAECDKLKVGDSKVLKILQVSSAFLLTDMIKRCIPFSCALPEREFRAMEAQLHPNIVFAVYEARFARSRSFFHQTEPNDVRTTICTNCRGYFGQICTSCRRAACERCKYKALCDAFHTSACDQKECFMAGDGSTKCLCGFTYTEERISKTDLLKLNCLLIV